MRVLGYQVLGNINEETSKIERPNGFKKCYDPAVRLLSVLKRELRISVQYIYINSSYCYSNGRKLHFYY